MGKRGRIMHVEIKGTTKLYAVIGNPIEHSFSPMIHNRIFATLGQDAVYIPLKIEEEHLAESIPMLRNCFEGFNVTIPHKQKIIPYLDEMDASAKRYGAVNTVKVKDRKLIGYNTDGYGFIKGLEMEGVVLKDQPVLLLGAGGAARMAAYELLQKGARLTIANRNVQRAQELKEELTQNGNPSEIKVCGLDGIDQGYVCMVNATPVGMFPYEEEVPVSVEVIKKSNVIYDLIYNPYHTKLLKMAQHHGCKVINGFPMLFYQAVKAQKIWLGDQKIREEDFQSIYQEIENHLRRGSR